MSFTVKLNQRTGITFLVQRALPACLLTGGISLPAGKDICYNSAVKFTGYFEAMRKRPDRSFIRLEWVQQVVNHPIREVVQQDGRIRRWASIAEMDVRILRVIVLADGETIHNAFFDRSFTP